MSRQLQESASLTESGESWAPRVPHFGMSSSKSFKSPSAAWTARPSRQGCSDLVPCRSSYVETPDSKFSRSALGTLNKPFHLHFSPHGLSSIFVMIATNVGKYLIYSRCSQSGGWVRIGGECGT